METSLVERDLRTAEKSFIGALVAFGIPIIDAQVMAESSRLRGLVSAENLPYQSLDLLSFSDRDNRAKKIGEELARKLVIQSDSED